jgi:hypothetical protein
MAPKKQPPPRSRPTPKARPAAPSSPPRQRLENLAARPNFDDTIDEQLVDHSGVFRVTSAIAQAQTGHEDGSTPRFASDSLVMNAQKGGFPEEPTVDEPLEEVVVETEASRASRRERLATLAARSHARKSSRR